MGTHTKFKKNHVDPRPDSIRGTWTVHSLGVCFSSGRFIQNETKPHVLCMCKQYTNMVHSQSQSETRGGAFAFERSRWWVDVFEGGFIRVMNRQCVLRVFRRFGRLAAARFDSTTTRLDDDSAPDDARLADATADATTDRSVFSRSFSSSRPGASDVVERRASGVVFGLDDDAFSREKEGAKEGRKDASSSNATDGSRDAVGDG